jgi:glycosyltransferase involved in cell wall biosynthesis
VFFEKVLSKNNYKGAEKMNVLHINTLWGKGGASKLAKLTYDLIKKNFNIESSFIVGEKFIENEEVFDVKKQLKEPVGYKKFKRICNERGFLYYFLPVETKIIIKRTQELKPDIIHFHNNHGGMFQLNLIDKLSKLAPVLWTFHDMFPITGHCGYSFDCKKWENGCGDCPYLDTYPAIKRDRTKALLKYKKKIYDKSDFTIVTPSKWLYDCVKKSVLKNKDVRLIYNGIDPNIFEKTDKFTAREKLSLPKDKKIILFSADGATSNPFKGGGYVVNLYEKLKNREDILFLNVGNNNEKQNQINWKNYRYVTDENEMALLYSSADVYLFPTLADNCPLTLIESMSCGLPVVTFDVGGVPEIVEHEKTGYIAKYKDPDDLLKGVLMLLDDENMREEFGKSGEKRAREMFDAKIMAERYYELYCELLNKKQ